MLIIQLYLFHQSEIMKSFSYDYVFFLCVKILYVYDQYNGLQRDGDLRGGRSIRYVVRFRGSKSDQQSFETQLIVFVPGLRQK